MDRTGDGLLVNSLSDLEVLVVSSRGETVAFMVHGALSFGFVHVWLMFSSGPFRSPVGTLSYMGPSRCPGELCAFI